ncbi:hypothetical protein EGI22_14665 [Lacihabitans sp. LS3-19]|uniref:hypothetical protein n=1 Tax=Lacihabitans sp. LS3-19 TaxID=2487335 RepID=UPI0020CF1813|nr:hypothetical protein [Lacihabitans sp. LS3-19]MCP9769158.1 hypothetical protein [Lacihabitans sp. LS3-19]
MKKVLLMTVLLGGGMAAQASIKKDTTIIEFNDKATNNSVKVISNTNKTIELPMKLNLESVLKAVGVDSNERERAFVMISKGGTKKDTLLLFSHEGQRIKIITKDIISKRDTTIKGSSEREMEEEIEDEIETYVEENENYKPGDHHNKSDKAPKVKKFFSRSDFAIYLGLNNFVKPQPASPNQLFELRPWQSRYVALSLRKNATLIKGNKVDVAFSYGPEIAWYNFMLQNNNLAKYESGQVSFVQNAKETDKSKLVMPYLNFPVLLNFGFKEDKFKIGFGGYAGYRVGGYSMEKYSRRSENKVKGSFGFNDVIYGLTTEIGKRNGLTVFARYDLNKLFKSNQTYAQDLQAFSVGFRL